MQNGSETVSDAVAEALVSLSNLPTSPPTTVPTTVPTDESVPASPSSDVRNSDVGSFVPTKDELHTAGWGSVPADPLRGRASTGPMMGGFPMFQGGLIPGLQQLAVVDAKARLATAPSDMEAISRPMGNWRRRKLEDVDDEDGEKRKMSHNMVERRRRNIINDNLSELQAAIPKLCNASKASKATVIRSAIDQIYDLTDENARWRAHAERLDRENALLREQLQRTCAALVAGQPTPYVGAPTPAGSPPPPTVESHRSPAQNTQLEDPDNAVISMDAN